MSTILLLDDDSQVRESLCMALEDHGFDVLHAESSERALDVLENEQADLVVVDLRLPGMNGPEFIKVAHGRFPHLQYIIYTGSPDFCLPKSLCVNCNISPTIFLKPLREFTNIIKEMSTMLSVD